MTQTTDVRVQAKQLYEAQDYVEAGKLYHQLWDDHGDAFSGGRYACCLRKAGHPDAALTVAQAVAAKYPDDVYVRREVVWALYDAKIKPARDRGDLGALVHFGQQIVDQTDEELPVRLVAFAVIGAAKDKMKWSIVSPWCDRINPQTLSAEPREMDGRRVISEREQWYFAKVKSLVELKQWDAAREVAVEAMQAFPRKRDFARWAAQALAGQGKVADAIAELEALLQQGQPEWYLLNDLAELKLQNEQAEAAYRLACRAALAFGEDKAKVGLFLLIARIALILRRWDVAARHAALSRLVRARESWSIPADLVRLEKQARDAMTQSGATLPEIPDAVGPLFKLCRRDWEEAVPADERPQPKQPRSRPPAPVATGETYTGQIKTYNGDRGFGFIRPDDGGKDIFFHISGVRGIDTPAEGLVVQYEVGESEKGPRAINVRPA